MSVSYITFERVLRGFGKELYLDFPVKYAHHCGPFPDRDTAWKMYVKLAGLIRKDKRRNREEINAAFLLGVSSSYTKTCSCCKTPKGPSEFHKNRSNSDGLRHNCKVCEAEAKSKIGPDGLNSKQRWQKNNPGYDRDRSYGISAKQFDAMLAEQGNACALCRDSGKKWCVDHDHATGKIRGILCFQCNIALGLLKDSPELALEAARYLTRHNGEED